MAKGKSGHRNNSVSSEQLMRSVGQDDPLAFINSLSRLSLPSRSILNPVQEEYLSRQLRPIRSHVPGGSVRSFFRNPVRAIVSETKVYRAVVCAKRKIRREVIHALKLQGRGRGGRRDYNETSKIKC